MRIELKISFGFVSYYVYFLFLMCIKIFCKYEYAFRVMHSVRLIHDAFLYVHN